MTESARDGHNTMNGMAEQIEADNPGTLPEHFTPEVELVLSRPAYRAGGTVVGTIRLVSAGFHPRFFFKRAQVYVAGRCRIDARWHNAEHYSQLYGSHPLLDDVMDKRVEARVAEAAQKKDSSKRRRDGRTVCFWATNVVNLETLPERQVGRWHDVKPQPLIVSGAPWAKPIPTRAENGSANTAAKPEHSDKKPAAKQKSVRESTSDQNPGEQALEKRQLAFSFRVDLPLDIVPTITATCCSYFYSVVVCAKTVDGELLVVQAPFTVLSPLGGKEKRNTSSAASDGRVKLGTCLAVAHSVGLPCHISATELHRPTGQITVNRHVGLLSTTTTHDVQTLRVADQTGTLCCILTVMGASVMSPGSRLLLQFDFPRDRKKSGTVEQQKEKKFLQCFQVSASLEGEELAINEDGTRNRARKYLFGGAHELVESGYTDRVSLSLCLPLDCPCTVQTDLLKIEVWCKVELTIERQSGGKGYSNLRLDLPCEVVHSPTADEMDNDDDEEDITRMMSLEELVLGKDAVNNDPSKFKTNDIMDDLKILSMLMIDNAGLREDIVT